MDGSGSAGNPSAASSRSLPAHADEGPLQPDHQMSDGREEERRRSTASPPGSQNHQSSTKSQRTAAEPEKPDFSQHTTQRAPPTVGPQPEDSPEDDPDQPEPGHLVAKPVQTGPDQPKSDQRNHHQGPDCPHQNHKDSCLIEQETEEDPPPPLPPPPPPMEDFAVFNSTLIQEIQKELRFHVSESKKQQNPSEPPPDDLTSNTAEGRHCHHDLSHLETPPPADQQTHPGPTEAVNLAPPLTGEVCDQIAPCPPASSTPEPKLCGFLLKQGGPLRAWKQRWFTYEEKKNQLFYYRTPQDVTPLGRVELSGATFTYPLKAEKGTFHIKTTERTFILKAMTQELMLYWLQQLQVKRWQHRQRSSCSDPTNNSHTADDFLPALKSPLGLVGEGAASTAAQRMPLTNMSIKHPLIEIQNSVHSLRKRSSQEWSQSVFHIEDPAWTPGGAGDSSRTASPRTLVESPVLPHPIPLADPGGQVSPAEDRESPSLFNRRSRKTETPSTSTMPVLRRSTLSSSSDRMARLQQEKQMLKEEVKAQKELVWILHKALEAAQLEKRTCAEFLAVDGEQDRLELLRHRERQAANLQTQLEEARMEAEAARRSLAERDVQLAELQHAVRMLTEKNNAKQEVIIKLSDQVTACLSDPRRSDLSSGGRLESQTLRRLQQDVENLKDDIEAYKTQNKFLNSEIYQLTKLWRTSSEQEKSLMVKCAYLEATNCQVESRYLGVLRKLQETKSLDPAQQKAVQKMVEDALKGELKKVMKLDTDRDHDEYGFKIIPDYEVEDMKLLAKIQALEIRSHNLLHQECVERPLLSRWAQYLAGRSDDDLCPSPELKILVRGGIPREYRKRVWRWLVQARTRTTRERHPQRYQQLCEKSRMSPHPASRQIQLDLHRTLTTNQHFSSPSSSTLQQLRRVLLAFSWQNPAIGYCQGLNRLAAIALLVLQSEEDAFWCLVTVVEAIMPQDYYTKSLVASQADQRVLKDFLAEKLPRLAAHFEDHGIDVSLITFNWFLVVFVESLPSDILLPLWDAFLYEGTKVMFRYALALFKYKEDDILKIHDSVEIYQYLRFFTKTISDGRRLTSIAFGDMNPFPRRLLRNRRALHLERLQAELRELEEQQKAFVTESTERKDKELDNMIFTPNTMNT
ncbi:TBC1 domain family member 2A-like isoform X2 [Parambassis ranga]|uniref:TBC1 domain family member 2A-like isoform X2 n=1 Tax=Parambassis ranga TaxID=210632 RepID=A0A6P7J411_9TELE|nr:TBC1 domain family member 2A-like isoform X2 [Parambassis ranga]